MKKKSECSVSGLIIESGMENDIVSANDHRKACLSETSVNDPLKNLAVEGQKNTCMSNNHSDV